jgi:hypothetical protein
LPLALDAFSKSHYVLHTTRHAQKPCFLCVTIPYMPAWLGCNWAYETP